MPDQGRVPEKSEENLTKVSLAQYHPTGALAENLRQIESVMGRAGRAGSDIICFSHDFLGPADDEGAALEVIREGARRHRLEVLTGHLALGPQRPVQSALIDADGAVVDSVESGVAKVMNGSLGPTMVLIERQAYDPAIDSVARELRPKVMLMQTNAISLLELEAIKELAVKRSYNQAHLIICASDVGPCADELCLGTSLAVFQGEILVEADVSAAGTVDFSVDMSKFLDYDVLRDAVEIPELLRLKYHN